MQITAAMVKELRERTGAGMMECKKSLTENGGDIEACIEAMRKSGLAKAEKKAGRIAAEGVICHKSADDNSVAVIVEINCETDFVTKADDFLAFSSQVADCLLANKPADVAALSALPLAAGSDETVEEKRQSLVAKIGENISIRRFEVLESASGINAAYLHGSRIGVLVDLTGGDSDLARDIAMHVAASRPVCIGEQDVPQELLDKEKEIFSAQAAESGKPAEIIEKMVAGRIKKYLKEVTLLGQPFVKDPDVMVEALLKKAGAEVNTFVRLEVGEGIEKKQENFAEEVMAQARG